MPHTITYVGMLASLYWGWDVVAWLLAPLGFQPAWPTGLTWSAWNPGILLFMIARGLGRWTALIGAGLIGLEWVLCLGSLLSRSLQSRKLVTLGGILLLLGSLAGCMGATYTLQEAIWGRTFDLQGTCQVGQVGQDGVKESLCA